VVALLSGALALSCSRGAPQVDLVDLESATITSWLGAAGARSVSAPERADTAWTKSTSWRAEVDVSWSQLVDRLRERPPIGYSQCELVARTYTCRRQLPGDVVQVEVRGGKDSPPAQISVHIASNAS
jgi:hypothetical protein